MINCLYEEIKTGIFEIFNNNQVDFVKWDNSTESLMIRKESPCVEGGIAIVEKTIEDFFGNPVLVNKKPCIGIHEFVEK